MGSRPPVLIIIIIGLAVAMPWVLAGCATTSAPPQDVKWLVGQWQGDFSASGIMARVGATGGPVTMTLREDGSFVSGDISGAGWRGTLRGRGSDTGYAGSLAFTAGQTSANVPFEFTRRGPDTLEGTIENSRLRAKRE
jgi:hypothetical protein